MTPPAPYRGFTLIEVLVALAITATALVAGTLAMSALTRLAERQTGTLLAQLCADNTMAQWRLSRQWPDIGRSEQDCPQAGRSLRVQTDVATSPNPDFRRVSVRVLDDMGPSAPGSEAVTLLSLSTVLGRP
jgi:general secretion pathway protein I